MTTIQYLKLCKLMEKDLTKTELAQMGFSPVDEVFDEDLAYDMTMLAIDERNKISS